MADVREAKEALARLAAGDRVVIERAAAATEDLAAAARFRERVGLDRLWVALERAEDPARAERGRAALRAFEAFAAAAAGDRGGDADERGGDAGERERPRGGGDGVSLPPRSRYGYTCRPSREGR